MGAAQRRGQRQLRAFLRYEELAVKMALAKALHHSAHQKTPLPGMRPGSLSDPGQPQRSDRTVRDSSLGRPPVLPPLLVQEEGIDTRTV